MDPDIKSILNSVVKSELNMLYTESPLMTNKGSTAICCSSLIDFLKPFLIELHQRV